MQVAHTGCSYRVNSNDSPVVWRKIHAVRCPVHKMLKLKNRQNKLLVAQLNIASTSCHPKLNGTREALDSSRQNSCICSFQHRCFKPQNNERNHETKSDLGSVERFLCHTVNKPTEQQRDDKGTCDKTVFRSLDTLYLWWAEFTCTVGKKIVASVIERAE